MTTVSGRQASTIWIMLLTLASTLTSLALGCAAPFEALAAIAATQMRARDGVWLMLLTWAINQGIGFGLLHYPHDPRTLLWGAAIGMAAVSCGLAARLALRRIAVRGEIARIAIAFLIATVAFKLVILLWSFALDGTATTLSPAILARQLVRNGEILVGLALLHRLLIALGVPPVRQDARAMPA